MRLNYRNGLYLIIILSISLSLTSFFYYSYKDVIVAYNDSRAHLNMARLVFDNLNPGLAQIGSVWLPLNHVLMLPFVWNHTLWQTGFAGSIASMVSYVICSLFIYGLVFQLTRRIGASILGSLVFLLNPNVLYMQATPMTELTLLMFFTGTSYFLVKWVKEKYNIIYLVLSAMMVFFATLTRYDAWFLFICMAPSIVIITLLYYKQEGKLKISASSASQGLRILEARLLLFLTVGGFGIFLWIIWNLLIFNDPFYFALGPYSAHAQQARIQEAGSLLTYKNLTLSIQAYWSSMLDNIGSFLMISSIIGLLLFLFRNKLTPLTVAVLTLLTPIAFHIISLYIGNSILVTPELGVKVTEEAKTSWFNVRYGLMVAPAIAVFSAYWAREKVLQMLLFSLIIIQSIFFYARNDVVTITDGVIGTSSLQVGDASGWIRSAADNEDGLILTSIAFNNALAFSSGVHLKRFVHEGTGDYWNRALTTPSKDIKWIIMANGDVGDEVYTKLVKENNPDFSKNFKLVLRGKYTNIYKNSNLPPN